MSPGNQGVFQLLKEVAFGRSLMMLFLIALKASSMKYKNQIVRSSENLEKVW
jgi:hypothetical protein